LFFATANLDKSDPESLIHESLILESRIAESQGFKFDQGFKRIRDSWIRDSG
jgi:hypothetical protein